MAAETQVEPPQPSISTTLSGVARVLVNAGKLSAKAAEELSKSARERKANFVATVVGANAVKPDEIAQALSTALALPLLDLNAVDLQKLPRNIIDAKIANQYQLIALASGATASSSARPTPPTRKPANASSSRCSCNPSG